MMQDQTTTTRTAASAHVCAKAAHLAAAYAGGNMFHVSSGSRPGVVYTVTADPRELEGETWACTCAWSTNGGRGCSHVRAAVRVVTAARARRIRRGA